MKPLTIDELKALEVGDWVWLTDEDSRYGTYARVCQAFEDDGFRVETMETYIPYSYSDYGKTWLAYKNKEQANGLNDIKRFAEYVGSKIAGHSDYHGDNILSALYAAAEGKEIKEIRPLEHKGEIVELPCEARFRQNLTVTVYVSADNEVWVSNPYRRYSKPKPNAVLRN